MSIVRSNILICSGTGCLASESEKVQRNLELILKARGYEKEVKIIKTGCFGFCEQGPIVKIEPEDIFYVRVGPKDAKDIIDEHIIKGRKVERLLYKKPPVNENIEKQENIPFYKKQLRLALRNCGLVDPEDIYEYIALGGYEALGKAITKMSRDEVIETVKKSKLRGRGGGGFPTGIKWEIAKNQKSDIKFIICNADEGDPGAFMDRSILEGDPHGILESMAIGGYAIGANKGIIYIRAEYPLAIERLKTAITQARELGFLGTKVFALAGKINNVGLVEVPMGITFREIIYDIGGGILGGKKFKAIQTGGPSGGVITENELDTPIDYDSLTEIGSMMGSGGMIVMDETDNMVNIAKFYLEFTMDESCGRCTPCRIGTKRLYEMLNKITCGEGTMADLDAMKQLAYMIKDGSLCGLGQTAPNPVISTMKFFWNEYLDLVKDIDNPQGEGRYEAKNKIGIES